ncbi:zinc ribbon domain-containing protein [uncultured Shimia sp.]|uniref:zinc ribbon domain-containing protein n=1 Tax=uncultured Shimia sp. TaxID=573152 RepID=UPI002631709C|nr:zinc ribbon domain-containing protein [uncultured Shimia sp.]
MKAVRRPQFWFNLAMWVMTLVISSLLIQLGALVMSDVPTAGKRISQADFVNVDQLADVELRIANTDKALLNTQRDIEDAEFVLSSRTLDYTNQRTSFENWVKTRSATEADSQNADVVARAQIIEGLKLAEREAQRTIEDLRVTERSLLRTLQDLRTEEYAINDASFEPYQKARRREVLKVFGLRLALTLPLLLISGWLVAKKRKSQYWPVYRSFVIFALFAFFVELVPYLPSYGGYVRNVVGIFLALLFAHFVIKGMNRYLARKRSEEQRPETEKRKAIAYETAVKKISEGVCPSCDRRFGAVKLRKGEKTDETPVDFCVHCGFCLFDRCANCNTRENSFFKFCGSCGTPSDNDPSVPAS